MAAHTLHGEKSRNQDIAVEFWNPPEFSPAENDPAALAPELNGRNNSRRPSRSAVQNQIRHGTSSDVGDDLEEIVLFDIDGVIGAEPLGECEPALVGGRRQSGDDDTTGPCLFRRDNTS